MPGINFRQQQLQGLDTAQQAWRLYVQHGLTHAQIATELSITRSAVTKAIKRAEELGLETLKASVATHKAVQLARLERIYCLAMDGFERSIGERVRKMNGTKLGSRGDELTEETRSEDGRGDPKWLSEARGALGDIRKLLGLDAPTKIQPVAADRPFASASDQELRAELAAMLERAGVELGTVIDVTPASAAPIAEDAAHPPSASHTPNRPALPPVASEPAQQTCRVCGCVDEAAVVWAAGDLCARCARS